jgi:hypothetical protein
MSYTTSVLIKHITFCFSLRKVVCIALIWNNFIYSTAFSLYLKIKQFTKIHWAVSEMKYTDGQTYVLNLPYMRSVLQFVTK